MNKIILTASFLFLIVSASMSAESLVEKLGYPQDTRLLIVNSDDVGMCHSANMAVIEGQEKGMISSGTIMVPCPWFPEIAHYAVNNPGLDFGVHLTHTSEWEGYRWGPVAPDHLVPGLLDPDGYLWKSVPGVYQNSSPEEAYIESRAQIEKFKKAGLEPTHIDSHMGTLMLNPEYLKVYVRLALEFNLPLRMASQEDLEAYGFPDIRGGLEAQGLIFPDFFIYDDLGDDYSENVEENWVRVVSGLKPGVTELYIHASLPGEDLKAATNSWKTRVAEYETFTRSEEIRRLLDEKNIQLISYAPLKELQRKIRNESTIGK